MGRDISSGSGLPGGKVGGSLFTSRSKCQASPRPGGAAMENPGPSCVRLPSREGSRERTAKNWDAGTSGRSWVISGMGSRSRRTPQLGDTGGAWRCHQGPVPLRMRGRVRGALSVQKAPVKATCCTYAMDRHQGPGHSLSLGTQSHRGTQNGEGSGGPPRQLRGDNARTYKGIDPWA